MSTQHTPAPWNYVQRGTQVFGISIGGCRMEETRHLIADVRGWGHLQYLPNGAEVQDANGLLIAAAPDLLQELINIASAKPSTWEDPTEFKAWAQSRAQAAIAKALGEK